MRPRGGRLVAHRLRRDSDCRWPAGHHHRRIAVRQLQVGPAVQYRRRPMRTSRDNPPAHKLTVGTDSDWSLACLAVAGDLQARPRRMAASESVLHDAGCRDWPVRVAARTMRAAAQLWPQRRRRLLCSSRTSASDWPGGAVIATARTIIAAQQSSSPLCRSQRLGLWPGKFMRFCCCLEPNF